MQISISSIIIKCNRGGNMSRIGNEVNKNRIKAGMTQKQLAKAIGVSESFIRDVEAGSKIISDDLFSKIAKVLNCDEGIINLTLADNYVEPKAPIKKEAPKKSNIITENVPVEQIWGEALGSILRSVPIYDFNNMNKPVSKRQMAIENNKINGYPKDKVFYLTIKDSEMSGLRIHEGDIAFCVTTSEVDKDGIYFIEYNGERIVRQLKPLQNDILLMISNKNILRTESVKKKDIKVLAKLIMVEVML